MGSSAKTGKFYIGGPQEHFFGSTRMHSSRMRTGCSLTVCCSLLLGGVSLVWGVSAPGGLVRGVSGLGVSGPGRVSGLGGVWSGGTWSGGCLLPGVCLVRGVCPGCVPGLVGVCLIWGMGVCLVCRGSAWGVSQHALRQTPLPPVNRHTLVKILSWPNFVAAGKNIKVPFGIGNPHLHIKPSLYVCRRIQGSQIFKQN